MKATFTSLVVAAFIIHLGSAVSLLAADEPDLSPIVQTQLKQAQLLSRLQFTYTVTFPDRDRVSGELKTRKALYSFYRDGSSFAFHGTFLERQRGAPERNYFTYHDGGYQSLFSSPMIRLTRSSKKADRDVSGSMSQLPIIRADMFLYVGNTLTLDSLSDPKIWSDFLSRTSLLSVDDKTISVSVRTDRSVRYEVTFDRATKMPVRYVAISANTRAEEEIKYAKVSVGRAVIQFPVSVVSRCKTLAGDDMGAGISVVVDQDTLKVDQEIDKEVFDVPWSEARVVIDTDADVILKNDEGLIIHGEVIEDGIKREEITNEEIPEFELDPAKVKITVGGKEVWIRESGAPVAPLDQKHKFGMTLNKLDRFFVVLGVLKDGPAVAAGVRVGDMVKTIDGVPVSDLNNGELQELFTTRTTCRIEVVHPGGKDAALELGADPP